MANNMTDGISNIGATTSNTQNNVQNSNPSNNQLASSSKQFNQLEQGDKFKAKVVDIKPNQVTIKMDNGQTLTAESRVLPDARIGDDSIFQVTEKFKGQILLEMVKPDENIIQANILKDALSNAGLKNTPENLELVKTLVGNNLPIDENTIQKAAYFKHFDSSTLGNLTNNEKSIPNLDISKVLFLIKENIPTLPINIEIINNIENKTLNMSALSKDLAKEIININDIELQTKLINIIDNININHENKNVNLKELLKDLNNIFLNSSFSKLNNTLDKNDLQVKDLLGKIEKEITNKLHFNVNKTSENSDLLKDIPKYYKEVHQATSLIEENIKNINNTEQLSQNIALIKGNIEFMNNISEYKQFLQIPLLVNGQEQNGELVIFKNKKGEKNYTKSASILISMDYLNLGKVEVYINKTYNDLQVQLRSEKNDVLKIISANSPKLVNSLNSIGFSLSSFQLKMLKEPFSLTKNEEEESQVSQKRYSFDMRI